MSIEAPTPHEVKFLEPQKAGLQARLLIGGDALRVRQKRLQADNLFLPLQRIGQEGITAIDRNTLDTYRTGSRIERAAYWKDWEESGVSHDVQMNAWTEGVNNYLTRVKADESKSKFLDTIGITDAASLDIYAKDSDMGGFVETIRSKVAADELKTADVLNNWEIIKSLSVSFGYDSSEITLHLLNGMLNTMKKPEEYISEVKKTINIDPLGYRLISRITYRTDHNQEPPTRRPEIPSPIRPAEEEHTVFPTPIPEEAEENQPGQGQKETEEHKRIIVGKVYDIKKRDSMQDFFTSVPNDFGGETNQSFFAVFDGHGKMTPTAEEANAIETIRQEQLKQGTDSRIALKYAEERVAPDIRDSGGKVAALAAEKLPDFFLTFLRQGMGVRESIVAAYIETDLLAAELGEGYYDVGTTALTVFRKGRKLWIAHAGDTRAVLIKEGEFLWASEDHGILNAVYKSIGDHSVREQNPNWHIPEVHEFELDNKEHRLILASDGLWGNNNQVTNEQAVTLIKNVPDAQEASDILKDAASVLNDNLTILIVDIPSVALTK